MDREIVGFVALDYVLGRFPRSMMRVSLEACIGSDLLDDDSANPASLGSRMHGVA